MRNGSIKIGLLGAGKFGTFHARNLTQTNFEFVGVYDPVLERAVELSENSGVQCFEDPNRLMAACDAVLIVTTTVNHFPLIRQAIIEQKHIFVEKPIVANIREMAELAELTRNYPKVMQIGHLERFNLMLQNAFTHSERPLMINAVRLSPFNPRVSDVSVVHDLMIHDIDTVMTIAGSEISDVRASGHSVISGSTDVCHATLTFRNGMSANLLAGRIFMESKREMDIFYTNRQEHLDFQNRTSTINYFLEGTSNPPENDFKQIMNWPQAEKAQSMWHKMESYPENNAILSELEEFYESILLGNPVRVGIRDAERTMHIIDLIEGAMNRTEHKQALA